MSSFLDPRRLSALNPKKSDSDVVMSETTNDDKNIFTNTKDRRVSASGNFSKYYGQFTANREESLQRKPVTDVAKTRFLSRSKGSTISIPRKLNDQMTPQSSRRIKERTPPRMADLYKDPDVMEMYSPADLHSENVQKGKSTPVEGKRFRSFSVESAMTGTRMTSSSVSEMIGGESRPNTVVKSFFKSNFSLEQPSKQLKKGKSLAITRSKSLDVREREEGPPTIAAGKEDTMRSNRSSLAEIYFEKKHSTQQERITPPQPDHKPHDEKSDEASISEAQDISVVYSSQGESLYAEESFTYERMNPKTEKDVHSPAPDTPRSAGYIRRSFLSLCPPSPSNASTGHRDDEHEESSNACVRVLSRLARFVSAPLSPSRKTDLPMRELSANEGLNRKDRGKENMRTLNMVGERTLSWYGTVYKRNSVTTTGGDPREVPSESDNITTSALSTRNNSKVKTRIPDLNSKSSGILQKEHTEEFLVDFSEGHAEDSNAYIYPSTLTIRTEAEIIMTDGEHGAMEYETALLLILMDRNYPYVLDYNLTIYRKEIYDEALEANLRELKRLSKELSNNHPEVIALKAATADLYKGLGMPLPAEKMLQEVLDKQRVKYDATSVDVICSLNDMGLLLLAMHRYDEAKKIFEEVVSTTCRTLGVAHPDVASALGNLAVTLRCQNNFADAIPLHERAIVILDAANGYHHLDTAYQRAQLGMSLLRMGGVQRGKRLMKEASSNFRDVNHLPNHHPWRMMLAKYSFEE